MKNCKNKNGLPMKWVMTNLFHEDHYEHSFSHIGMGRRNLEFFARIYPTDRSYFHQPDHRLDTVHQPPNHHRYSAVCGTQRQTSTRHLSSPVSKIPLAADSSQSNLSVSPNHYAGRYCRASRPILHTTSTGRQ